MVDINSRFIPLPTESPDLKKDWSSTTKSISSALVHDLAVVQRHCKETTEISSFDSIYLGVAGEVKFNRYRVPLIEHISKRGCFHGISYCRERDSTIGRNLRA